MEEEIDDKSRIGIYLRNGTKNTDKSKFKDAQASNRENKSTDNSKAA